MAAQQARQAAEAHSAKLKAMLEKALVGCPPVAGPFHPFTHLIMLPVACTVQTAFRLVLDCCCLLIAEEREDQLPAEAGEARAKRCQS